MNKKLKKALSEFVPACKKRFGKNLVIILFGSHAKGTANEFSDIDLLVIVQDLPSNMIKRLGLMDDFVTRAIKKYHVRSFPVFYEPKEFSTERINPLVYGILTGYNSFWKKILARIFENDQTKNKGNQTGFCRQENMGNRKIDIGLVKEFIATSKSDLDAAENELKSENFYNSVYHSQQCVEKICKSLLIIHNKFVSVHIISSIFEEVARKEKLPEDIRIQIF